MPGEFGFHGKTFLADKAARDSLTAQIVRSSEQNYL